MMTDYATPPRGWLYGFVLAISAFWISGVTREAFRNHEIGVVRLIGTVILLISMAMIAYQALTDQQLQDRKGHHHSAPPSPALGLALIIIGGLYH